MSRRNFFRVLVGVVALAGLGIIFGVTTPSSAQRAGGLATAIRAQERHTNGLMARNGVVGTGVGLNPNGQHVVKVYVVNAGDGAGIPKKLDGVPVVVQVTGEIIALADPKAQFDLPVPIGVSASNEESFIRNGAFCTTGTLGARLLAPGGAVRALSNNHIFANENRAALLTEILQPGLADNFCRNDDNNSVIGTLFDFVPIEFDRRANNTVDAAIASTTPSQVGNATPDDGYGTPNSAIAAAFLGQGVQKYGRTTGNTSGRVDAINVTVIVRYDSGQARFVNQFGVADTVEVFSAGGDSGSLVVTNDANNNPVGLLFAGGGGLTICNPIGLVLDAFGVTIDGAAPVASPTGTITGTVTDSSMGGGPIAGASVSAETGQSDTTAANGTYTLSEVPTGDRTVTASADLYVAQSALINVADGANSVVDFSLDPEPAPTPGTEPVVLACTPNNGNLGDRLTVAVTGSNFQDGATVQFGARIAVQGVTFVSSSRLDVRIKIQNKAAFGARNVTVTNPDGQSGTGIGCFTVNP